MQISLTNNPVFCDPVWKDPLPGLDFDFIQGCLPPARLREFFKQAAHESPEVHYEPARGKSRAFGSISFALGENIGLHVWFSDQGQGQARGVVCTSAWVWTAGLNNSDPHRSPNLFAQTPDIALPDMTKPLVSAAGTDMVLIVRDGKVGVEFRDAATGRSLDQRKSRRGTPRRLSDEKFNAGSMW